MNAFETGKNPIPGTPIAALVILILSFAALAQQAAQRTFKILILGDSLTEGLGVEKDDAFPARLDDKLKKWREGVQVINGGSSGSTSASGVRRLKWYEKAKPD